MNTMIKIPCEKKLPSNSSRKNIPENVKEKVRDNYQKCANPNCDKSEILEVDHIIPVSRGGSNNEKNLQVLCRSCNRSKCDKTMNEFLEEKQNEQRT